MKTYLVPTSAEFLADGMGARFMDSMAESFGRFARGECTASRFGYWCEMGGGHRTAHVDKMGRWWLTAEPEASQPVHDCPLCECNGVG